MAQQNGVKIILHVDMNAFFCAVACNLYPYLKGKAFAIGRENSYRGVVSTASYEARNLGVHSAMSLKEAYEKIPDLLVISLDYSHYIDYHNRFLKILKEYTNLVEVASIDEAYLDITALAMTRHPIDIAKEIQSRILKEAHLSCSIGIAPTLFLAKMASDLKKPLGLTVLRKRDVKDLIYPLSVKEIYGIGKKTYPGLIEGGILTIGDFMAPENKLKIINLIGQANYEHTVLRILGKSSDVVTPNRYSSAESISTSQTFDRIINSDSEILYEMRKMTREVVGRLKNEKYLAKTITITLRSTAFKTITRSKTLKEYTNDFQILYEVVTDLIEQNYHEENLRLLGVALANLVHESALPKEYNLFTIDELNTKIEVVEEIIKDMQSKYGEKALFRPKK